MNDRPATNAERIAIGVWLDGFDAGLGDDARMLRALRRALAAQREEIAQAIEAAGSDPYRNLGWMYPDEAARIAREHGREG